VLLRAENDSWLPELNSPKLAFGVARVVRRQMLRLHSTVKTENEDLKAYSVF
jgi:hypothetical protein